MDRVVVALYERSYPINIGIGLLNNLAFFLPLKAGDRAMLITNETVAKIYLDHILHTLQHNGIIIDTIVLSDGEQNKNLAALNMIFTALLKKSHGRDTTLIALGGGVVGDLTGFAAASYQRGVHFIQIPTTLLAQVDSAIGGKTSINHPLGKNMIGAIYQPISVIIDLDCLKTLPKHELISGMAEVIKYGIIMDGNFFYWLEDNIDALISLDIRTLKYCIRRCCELKAKVVLADEREIGVRTLLNLGHTFGHAIEAEMGYGKWLHGEAVAVGMVIAARVSERLGYFTNADIQRIIMLLMRTGLPVIGPSEMTIEKYLPHIMRDKKVLAGEIRLVLPIEIGRSVVYSGVSQDVIRSALADCH